MSRKPKFKDGRMVSIYLPAKALEELDRRRKVWGMSRGEYIVYLLNATAEDWEDAEAKEAEEPKNGLGVD